MLSSSLVSCTVNIWVEEYSGRHHEDYSDSTDPRVSFQRPGCCCHGQWLNNHLQGSFLLDFRSRGRPSFTDDMDRENWTDGRSPASIGLRPFIQPDEL